jgi:dipeptide/tripeptide permease
MTNIEKRGFHSVLAETAVGMIAGFGIRSYILGMEAMLGHLAAQQPKSRKPAPQAAPRKAVARRA